MERLSCGSQESRVNLDKEVDEGLVIEVGFNYFLTNNLLMIRRNPSTNLH